MSLGIVGLALGAIGTGVQVYSGIQAAKTQETFATLNAQAGLAQSQMQAAQATQQAALQSQQSLNQRQAAQANAAAIQDEAQQRTRASQINLARQQEDHRRFVSMLRARGAKTGTVVDTGGQLDIILQAAELQALENAESHYQTEVQRRQLFREATNARLGGDLSGIQSGLDLLEGQARASAYRAQGTQAQLQGLAGVSAARGTMMSAIGGGIGSFGQLGYNTYKDFRLGALRF